MMRINFYRQVPSFFTHEQSKAIIESAALFGKGMVLTPYLAAYRASYRQFLCQRQNFKRFFFLIDILCVVVIPFTLFFLLLVGLKKKKRSLRSTEVAFIPDPNLLPNCSRDILVFDSKLWFTPVGLTLKEFQYCFRVFCEKPFAGFFNLKFAINMVRYTFFDSKHLNTIYVSNEYSFTCSLLTQYFESQGIEIVNLQHGLKNHEVTDAFAQHTKHYVWDKETEILLCQKYCEAKFDIITPKSLDLLLKKAKSVSIKNELVYFLQGFETNKEIIDLNQKLKIVTKYLKLDGYYFKSHPINKIDRTGEIFSSLPFYCDDSSLAVIQSRCVVSAFSTALYESALLMDMYPQAGRMTVINDIIYPHHQGLFLEERCERLSALIQGMETM